MDYRDGEFEWNEAKGIERMARSGFDFHAAKRVFDSDRYVERLDERRSTDGEDRWIATGELGGVFISVVYVERFRRRRIVGAFEADDRDIEEYLVTYAIEE